MSDIEVDIAVVSALTGCFAGAGDGVPERGLGSAEHDGVLNAWKLYCGLVANLKVMRRWADRCHREFAGILKKRGPKSPSAKLQGGEEV